MQISVEISYYPMLEEYIPPILSFVDRLKNHDELQLKSSGMSTLVFGHYSDVMKALSIEIEKYFEIPHSVFVLKIMNTDMNHHTNSHE